LALWTPYENLHRRDQDESTGATSLEEAAANLQLKVKDE